MTATYAVVVDRPSRHSMLCEEPELALARSVSLKQKRPPGIRRETNDASDEHADFSNCISGPHDETREPWAQHAREFRFRTLLNLAKPEDRQSP